MSAESVMQREHRFWVKSPGLNNPFDYELYFAERVFDTSQGRTISMAYPLPAQFKIVKEIEDGVRTDFSPLLQVSQPSMQTLMDSLWLQGFRPSEKLTKPIIQS